jgi:3-oxoacyl-[acyl-carrier protein] reductase
MVQTLDLGLEGRSAIVCGSTQGLGHACAVALADAGVEVIVNGRSKDSVDAVAGALSQRIGRAVRGIAADVTTIEGRDTLLSACPKPDILVNNAAGPKPGSFADWDEAAWAAALSNNMIAPIMLIRAVVPAMQARRWGRIINITSGAVKAPLPLLGLSNGARSGLTGFVAGLAREIAGAGITVNNLLPGNFATARLKSYAAAVAQKDGRTFDETWADMARRNPSGRLGNPEEFGTTCAFLASVHAGYITGQNILLDGGSFPGVL